MVEFLLPCVHPLTAPWLQTGQLLHFLPGSMPRKLLVGFLTWAPLLRQTTTKSWRWPNIFKCLCIHHRHFANTSQGETRLAQLDKETTRNRRVVESGGYVCTSAHFSHFSCLLWFPDYSVIEGYCIYFSAINCHCCKESIISICSLVYFSLQKWIQLEKPKISMRCRTYPESS